MAGTVPEVVSQGEGGLLGLTISPAFEDDATLYVFHTAAEDNRIARMTFDGDSLDAYQPLLTGIGKASIHNAGRLASGPDGYLYATTGDAADPALAQDETVLEGKILRLTPEGDPAPGNPFENDVYSYGHPNPQGLAWDAEGRLWSFELDQDTWGELNLIEPSANYGWPVCEGVCEEPGMTSPKEQWPTSQSSPSGLSCDGGALYMAALRGQRLWRIPISGTEAGSPEAHYQGELGRLRTVATAPAGGELWLSSTNADGAQHPGSDTIYRVTLE